MQHHELVTTTVKFTMEQMAFINQQSKNRSRFIRSLVDKAIGERRAQCCEQPEPEQVKEAVKQKNQAKKLTWSFPD